MASADTRPKRDFASVCKAERLERRRVRPASGALRLLALAQLNVLLSTQALDFCSAARKPASA